MATEDGVSSQLLRTCVLGTHDEAFSRQDVLINHSLFPPEDVAVGTQLQITPVAMKTPQQGFEIDIRTAKIGVSRRNTFCNNN